MNDANGDPDRATTSGEGSASPAPGPGGAPSPSKRSRQRRRRPTARADRNQADPNSRADPNRRADADTADPNRRADSDHEGATPSANAAEPGNRLDGPTRPTGPKRRRRSRRRSRSGSGDGTRASEGGAHLAAADDASPVSEASRALSDSLQAAVLGHTSRAVLDRGRGYVKRNRVTELRVSAARIRARVLGSEGERYRIELTAPQTPAPAVVTKIRWSCDCLYAAEHRRGTCKHVVAVALLAARRFERTDALRRRWMGGSAAEAPEAEPAEFDALAERLRGAFTAPPVSPGDALARAIGIAPPPFSLREPRA